jgi:uncharacterized protein (TIGR02611 family)
MDPIKHARRVAIAVIGSTVLLVGVVLLVLPGPAFIVIPVGLAILSTEFVWAARLLKRVKENAQYAAQSVLGPRNGTANTLWARISSWVMPKHPATDRPVK